MKYIAVLDTDEIEDFNFFEDGKEKYLHAIDANSVNGEWIYLPFKPLEQQPTTKNNLVVDCIDRAKLLKAMDTWDKFGYTTRYGLERLDKDDKGFVPYVKYDDMVNCVKGMPSVTPQEPKTGKWISTETKGVRYAFWCRYKCSLCGGLSVHTNFCPNCGAKMESEGEADD